MEIFFTFLAGFFLLFFGGELLIKGSINTALHFNLSKIVIGVTIVSFATSAPELFVSIQALIKESSNIALGNVIGSNIANLALVLSITAIIFRVKTPKEEIKFNFLMLIFSSLLLGFILLYYQQISFYFGYFFIILLCLFLYYSIVKSKKLNENATDIVELDRQNKSLYFSVIFIFLGVIMLKYGADFLVNSAIDLANIFHVSDKVIAVTIIAIGTSIPELATSVIAAIKKEDGLAIGNLIGSNIFNVFGVLGVSACIKNISLDNYSILSYDYLIMIFVTIILGIMIHKSKKQEITRKSGVILLLIYLTYILINLYE